MGLKLFGYSELSSDFGDWLYQNCSNCEGNFDNIPKCFFKDQWSINQATETPRGWNFQQHYCTWGGSAGLHYDSWWWYNGDVRPGWVKRWPPKHTITMNSDQDVTITRVSSDTIKRKLYQYLSEFKDKDIYATENGLITYMNIIGKFMVEHFTFVTSPFSTQLLTIYTDNSYAHTDTVPQNTLSGISESLPPDESTRNVVHSEPIKYYMDKIFQNIKHEIRKVQFRYTVTFYNCDNKNTTYTIGY